jgi:hypothetical protein
VTPEEHSGRLAEVLTAQSARLDEIRMQRARVDAAVAVVQRPGDAPTVADHREWALREAAAAGIVIKPTDRPRMDMVIGGQVVRGEVPYVLAFGPDNAAEADAEWARRRRAQEDAILVARYGRAACERSGIL